MTTPAYQLRPNKAVDRQLLMEAMELLARMDGDDLRGYTYYGFGGPYLEDFRLLYERHPEIGMVSIEKDWATLGRQEFHRPCSTIELVKQNMSKFIEKYRPDGTRSVFWLDYTGLEYRHFTDFQNVLDAVVDGSMVKVTLLAEPKYFRTRSKPGTNNKEVEFRDGCNDLMPNPSARLPGRPKDFASLLQGMVRIAAERRLSKRTDGRTFVPVSSFWYSDGTWMFTLTGVVCGAGGEDKLREAFADWEFANLEWGPPTRINVPALSTKERLCLQSLLPTETPETTLLERLGYPVDGGRGALRQYADFHRYAPYFLKGIP